MRSTPIRPTHALPTRKFWKPAFPCCWRIFISAAKAQAAKGKWHAGDGTRRTIRALEKLDFAILSGHRRVRLGLKGGKPGETGRNEVRRKRRLGGSAERM
ncbi:hydantoinase B/oxoprolinase family protein [Brucella abortus]|nr:hydantoinase B/oxoprolinase family protein [Brucella abortus]